MVFIDSSGFIATFDDRDSYHPAAVEAWRHLAKTGEGALTTDLVIAETVSHLRRRTGWEQTRRAGASIFNARAVDIAFCDRELIGAAWRDFLRNADPRLSLCDSVSFVIMRERGVTKAFTFDRHFMAAGFALLP